MGAEGQFDPFLDEIIDSNDLPTRLPTPSEMAQDRADPGTWIAKTAPIQGSKHVLHEMAIVKSRLGFDEQAFREQCQRVHSELSQEFKGCPLLVDGRLIAQRSSTRSTTCSTVLLRTSQRRCTRCRLTSSAALRGSLPRSAAPPCFQVRRRASPARVATMEQSIHAFLSQMQQAYTAAFNDQSRSN